ncbi:hypothetical protein [Rosenbergiella epipactidis]|uniref:hypothetical protein n=1 Tax=Rosenbergiella epipactidis TaxID=1544694 RepID=UPI001F4E535E|nr:hypothetical protein [Rosenbergiella epipactidis]
MSTKRTLNALVGQATIALLSINNTLTKDDLLLYLSQQRDSLYLSHSDFYTISNVLNRVDQH